MESKWIICLILTPVLLGGILSSFFFFKYKKIEV